MTTVEARIKAKIDGREMAQSLYGAMLPCEGREALWEDGTGADYAESLLKELTSLLPQRRKPEQPEEKLVPIARLGLIVLEYGKHAGKCLDDAPVDYLQWLCGAQERANKQLSAYLNHPEFEARRGHEN